MASRSARPQPVKQTVEVVDPRWLLKAAALVLAAALLCGYLTVCGLFYFGQWQFVLHPSSRITRTPAEVALPFRASRFPLDAASGGRLTNWAIPSDSPADPTVLLLHGGDGNLSDTVPLIQMLHTARLNVFAVDYAGYGDSGGPHPTEARLAQDCDDAFSAASRGVPSSRIILVGSGLGASLAVRLAAKHPEVAAVILDQPDGDVTARIARDPRTRLIPVRLLIRDSFPLQKPLETLATPKLIITHRESPPPLDARLAADPKMTVELAPGDTTAYLKSLRRFLDTYVARPVPTLLPAPASR